VSGRQIVPGSAEMHEEGTQYRQRPWATRSAAAPMLSTVPWCTVGVNPADRHISTVNWLNSGARTKDLPRLGQERRSGCRQCDVVGAAFQQADAQLTLEPLHLLAQRRLHDMLSGGGAAEVQFLGQGHEIAKLPQLHVFTPSRPR
jgi:hypothetical protein